MTFLIFFVQAVIKLLVYYNIPIFAANLSSYQQNFSTFSNPSHLNPFQYKHKPYQTINLRKDFLLNFFLTFVQFGMELACIGTNILPMSGRRADVGSCIKRFKKIFQKKVLKMFADSKKSANFVAVISWGIDYGQYCRTTINHL